jgi:hypothetical protein
MHLKENNSIPLTKIELFYQAMSTVEYFSLYIIYLQYTLPSGMHILKSEVTKVVIFT